MVGGVQPHFSEIVDVHHAYNNAYVDKHPSYFNACTNNSYDKGVRMESLIWDGVRLREGDTSSPFKCFSHGFSRGIQWTSPFQKAWEAFSSVPLMIT